MYYMHYILHLDTYIYSKWILLSKKQPIKTVFKGDIKPTEICSYIISVSLVSIIFHARASPHFVPNFESFSYAWCRKIWLVQLSKSRYLFCLDKNIVLFVCISLSNKKIFLHICHHKCHMMNMSYMMDTSFKSKIHQFVERRKKYITE